MVQPLPPPHPRARAHQGRTRGRSPDGADHPARNGAGARRRPGLPHRVRVARRGGRGDGAAAARGVRARPAAGGAPATLPPWGPRPQPRPRGAGAPARGPVRGHRRRPRPRPRPRPAPGRLRRRPPWSLAGRLRAPAARQLVARARLAGGDGRPLRRPSRRGGRDRRAGRAPALRPARGARLSLSGSRGRGGRGGARRALPRRAGGALRPRLRSRRGARPPGGGTAGDRAARPRRLLPPAPRHGRAGARGGGRGPGARQRPRRPPAGPRAGLLGVLDRLLPDRPLARRPDPQRAVPRPLPQRGVGRPAGHRPRLPPRHPRDPHPPRPRALRARPLGPRGRVPHVPRAGGDPRAGQGARPSARRGRAGRPRLGGLVGARRGARRRRRARGAAGADGALALARAPGGRGARPPAPLLPAPRRDDRRHPAARGLLPGRPGSDGGAPDRPVGQGLLLRRGLFEDRPARAGDALGGRAVGRPHRAHPRRADRPLANSLRRPRGLPGDPGGGHDGRLPDREPRADGLPPPDATRSPSTISPCRWPSSAPGRSRAGR